MNDHNKIKSNLNNKPFLLLKYLAYGAGCVILVTRLSRVANNCWICIMLEKPITSIAVEYALIGALVSIAAVAAADASYFAIAGLCFFCSLACFRRLGILIAPRLRA